MKYFAHRGLSDYAPENTKIAFQMALKAGAKAIELDVQQTRDGEIVVIHDFTLGRTNNGKGFVKDMDYAELQKLDAGSWFGEAFSGEKILTLEEVFQILPEDIEINIELKKLAIDKGIGFAEKVVNSIQKYPHPVIVSSFDHHLLKGIQTLDTSIRLGLLYCSNLIDVLGYAKANGLNIFSIHPSLEYVSPELVEKAHQNGISVNVYTVRSKGEADLLEKAGVDGIFVNCFDWAKQ